MGTQKTHIRRKSAVLLTTAITVALFSAPSAAQTQVRLQSQTDTAAFSEGYKLSVEDWSAQTKQAQAHSSTHFHHQSQDRPQVWISDIGTLLFDDADGDGYHAGFSITIDVDSEYGDTEVYANIYLQSALDPLVLLHKTSRFSIYGSTIGDEYRIDTELRNNFAAGEYDVMVDVHDAWSDQLLDTANARGFSNLSGLPLESGEQNQSQDDQQNDVLEIGSDDVIVTEYAGAFHPLVLMTLFVGWIARRRLG